jgi:DNA-directed RNA polymerase specialized sigma subunit
MSNEQEDNQLSEAVRGEESFVREKLKEELGREPTAEEINEWLREHTESY